jgi:hypothetical protein
VLNPIYPEDFVAYTETGRIIPTTLSAFSARARAMIQEEIDKRGGTGDFYRGHMARIKGVN